MKVSNRQRRILEVLLHRHGDVTAGQLAQEVGISARTVHRELQELEPIVASHGIALHKKSGIGISLEGGEDQLIRFQEELHRSETETFSPDERKLLILCRLLDEEEPVKLFTLAREVQAAIPTVSHDLDELEPLLARGELDLIRRRGYGVEIAGSETAKRRFMVWMAEEYLDHSDLFGTPSGPSDSWSVTRRLLDLVGKNTFLEIEHALWELDEEWLSDMQESDYTRLLIRLSVAITRFKRNHRVKNGTAGESAGHADAGINANRLAFSLGLGLPETEARFVQNLFDEAQKKALHIAAVILEKYGLELAEQTVDLIRSVEKRVDIPLSEDRSLLDGLIRHLGPTLERLERGETVRNPLLAQIRKDYESLFATVKQSAAETWPSLNLPDEEIAYLVMHFGAAAERWTLTPNHVKALLVCTSGIGTSKMLAVRINKEIPQIDLIGHYSWYEASRMPPDRYDLIISTVDLPVEPQRYIKLSPLLTREETEKLRSRIREMTSAAHDYGPAAQVNDRGAWERLKLMESYSAEMVRLLKPFHVYDLDSGTGNNDLHDVLTAVLRTFSADHDALERTDLIVRQLMDREHQGSQLIPETELALFHTRSEWVRRPVLALFRLKVPLKLGDDGSPGAQTSRILLMLAPDSLNKPALEVLSEISALLLLPEMMTLLQEGGEDEIRAFISRNLESYIENKLDWRDPT